MTKRQNATQVMDYGRLMGIQELMCYTSLGRNTAMELGKNANAIVRMGKRTIAVAFFPSSIAVVRPSEG